MIEGFKAILGLIGFMAMLFFLAVLEAAQNESNDIDGTEPEDLFGASKRQQLTMIGLIALLIFFLCGYGLDQIEEAERLKDLFLKSWRSM